MNSLGPHVLVNLLEDLEQAVIAEGDLRLGGVPEQAAEDEVEEDLQHHKVRSFVNPWTYYTEASGCPFVFISCENASTQDHSREGNESIRQGILFTSILSASGRVLGAENTELSLGRKMSKLF